MAHKATPECATIIDKAQLKLAMAGAWATSPLFHRGILKHSQGLWRHEVKCGLGIRCTSGEPRGAFVVA